MAKKNSGKIRQYRRPLNINIGVIIFGTLLLYIVVCVFTFFTSKHVSWCEVQAGSLSVENTYRAVALREETIVNSDYSGYISYYAREGERVGNGSLVCTVDGSGKLKEMMNEQAAEDVSLSEKDLSELKSQISDFAGNFSEKQFSSVYDFKYDIEGSVLKLANINVLDQLDIINAGGNAVNLCNSPKSGIITYYTDGYEELTADQITESSFDEENYVKNQLLGNELIENGNAIYKICESENWSIVIPVSSERAKELEEAGYVKVRFLKNQNISWGEVKVLHTEGENTYVQLSFTNSMITFCTERFLDVELLTSEVDGLKIPVSAVTEKEFFVIPGDYISQGNNSSQKGVYKEVAAESGEITIQFLPVSIYWEENGDYYVDDFTLSSGDHLVKSDSTETMTVATKATLTGAYNVNEGYAKFRRVKILNSNEEYAIIENGTKYGLRVYDHIVLDAETVALDELIYD